MIINDAVYGKQKITDKCVLEIIKTKAFQRLNGIKQTGITAYVSPEHKITRYEHCIGVYLLLRRFEASKEEQIAGLLHDLPHTAFSHVVDYVFNDGSKNYHEKLYEKILAESEIPKILEKHGMNPRDFFDSGGFKLLEQELPNLCADRIDYCLRDSLEVGVDLRYCLKHIIVLDGIFVFDSRKAALAFSLGFKNMNELNWENPYKSAIYMFAASILKLGLKESVIEEKDFLKTDKEVIEKIKSSNNKKLKQYLEGLKDYSSFEKNEQSCSFCVPVKAKHLDPLVLERKKLERLSHLNRYYHSMIEFYKQNMREGFEVSIKRI